MTSIIATSTTHSADDFVTRRQDFERVFLARAAVIMFGDKPGAVVPADVAGFLLRRNEAGEYATDDTQSLWIGWQMAVEDGAPSTAASAYRSQLEAHLRLAQAEVAQLKVSLQMTDPKFRRKVFWTRVLRFLKRKH